MHETGPWPTTGLLGGGSRSRFWRADKQEPRGCGPRFFSTSGSRFDPCRPATAATFAGHDVRSLRRLAPPARAPGSPPTGKPVTAPGFYLAFDSFSFSSTRRLLRPSPALHPWVSRTWTVTWLEPRTRYQPGKLKQVSKNDGLFTPARLEVNGFMAIICGYFSSSCSLSTGLCYETGAMSSRRQPQHPQPRFRLNPHDL